MRRRGFRVAAAVAIAALAEVPAHGRGDRKRLVHGRARAGSRLAAALLAPPTAGATTGS